MSDQYLRTLQSALSSATLLLPALVVGRGRGVAWRGRLGVPLARSSGCLLPATWLAAAVPPHQNGGGKKPVYYHAQVASTNIVVKDADR